MASLVGEGCDQVPCCEARISIQKSKKDDKPTIFDEAEKPGAVVFKLRQRHKVIEVSGKM